MWCILLVEGLLLNRKRIIITVVCLFIFSSFLPICISEGIVLPLTSGLVASDCNSSFSQNSDNSVYCFFDDDVGLIWSSYIGSGEDEEYKYTFLDQIDHFDINDDGIPDVLAGMYALDGENGEIIYQFERGVFLGLGDINNDGYSEIITGNDGDNSIDIFCINPIDRTVIWKEENINQVRVDIVIGNVTGDSTNEIIAAMNDVYCFDGRNGNILWTKHLVDGWICSVAISDVNNDGNNEIIVGTFNNDARVFCLDGNNGEIIWEYNRNWVGFASFRTLCIDNLNDDPYQEIVVEGNPDVGCTGLLCLSGYDGEILWTWNEEPRHGSFQAILSADIIPERPGKEVIAGGVGGIYCLYGGDNSPEAGRVIWHTEKGIIMSIATGDIDGDGFLDVVGATCGIGSGNGETTALKGQYGSELWSVKNGGNDGQGSTICVDINHDHIDEVFSLNCFYIERSLFNVSALQSNFSSDNHPPHAPVVEGPTQGTIRNKYSYSAVSTDEDDDFLYYYFDWGDGAGNISIRSLSGDASLVSHHWMEEGIYNIKVKAIDEHGLESDWSTLEVTMPKNERVSKVFYQIQNGYLWVKSFFSPISFHRNYNSNINVIPSLLYHWFGGSDTKLFRGGN